MKKASQRQPSAGGWVVLGLLLEEPRSGYELATLAQRSVGQFWPVTKAHVYGELPRLEHLGYATGKEVPQHGVPDKRVYTATAQGRAAFSDWLSKADLGEPLLRHPLLVQVFFGSHIATDRLLVLINAHRQRAFEAKAHFGVLLKKAAMSDEECSTAGQATGLTMRRLVVRHAIIRLEAELRWLDEVEKTLLENDRSAEQVR